MDKWFKKIGAEAILSVMVAPFLVWFIGFVISSYSTMAEVSSTKEDLKEIKQDVKEIRSFLLNNGVKNGR